MKITIKETEGFRLTLTKQPCAMPEGLFHIQMTQECLKDGDVSTSSVYQFFMTQDEIETLAKAIVK